MSQPFIGEIRMFAGNFPPNGWMFCEGQLLAISENDALFTLLGTTYGGDGEQTFALPDLRGRLPIHMGQGFVIGEQTGTETVTLTVNQIPAHSHAMLATSDAAQQTSPQSGVLATTTIDIYRTGATPNRAMNTQSIGPAGGSQPHENVMPFLCIDFIISLFGIFPQQN
jgi:microcystin-dependent protein